MMCSSTPRRSNAKLNSLDALILGFAKIYTAKHATTDSAGDKDSKAVAKAVSEYTIHCGPRTWFIARWWHLFRYSIIGKEFIDMLEELVVAAEQDEQDRECNILFSATANMICTALKKERKEVNTVVEEEMERIRTVVEEEGERIRTVIEQTGKEIEAAVEKEGKERREIVEKESKEMNIVVEKE
jgi:hypothetical protein